MALRSAGISILKITPVTPQQLPWIIGQKIKLRPNALSFSRCQTPYMRVAMQANINALEQFLCTIRSGRQQILAITGKTSNQSVGGAIEAKRPRIDIGQIDA